MYGRVCKVANTISTHLLVDPRNKELLWVSLACAAGTTLFTVNLILEQLAHPTSFPWTPFLLRQAFMAGEVGVQLSGEPYRMCRLHSVLWSTSIVRP